MFIQSNFPSVGRDFLSFLSAKVAPNVPMYSFFKGNVVAGNLIGVAAVAGFTNIPMLPGPPAEAYAIYSYSKGTNPVLIILLISAIVAATTGFSYFLGRIFGPKIITKMTKNEFKYSEVLDRLSAPIMFFTVLLPLPVPGIFPFLFGAYRSNYRNFMLAVFAATVLRFSVSLFLFHNYGDITTNFTDWIKTIF